MQRNDLESETSQAQKLTTSAGRKVEALIIKLRDGRKKS